MNLKIITLWQPWALPLKPRWISWYYWHFLRCITWWHHHLTSDEPFTPGLFWGYLSCPPDYSREPLQLMRLFLSEEEMLNEPRKGRVA